MKPKDNYKELVDQAQKAVASVKDPSLKQIAFQKVLDNLLRTSADELKEDGTPARTARKAKGAKSVGKKKSGPTKQIQDLVDDGFFKNPKIISQVKAELGNRGHHIALGTVGTVLLRLCKARVLRRAKLKGAEKNTFAYSIW